MDWDRIFCIIVPFIRFFIHVAFGHRIFNSFLFYCSLPVSWPPPVVSYLAYLESTKKFHPCAMMYSNGYTLHSFATIDITVSRSGGSEMRLALYSAAEDEPPYSTYLRY